MTLKNSQTIITTLTKLNPTPERNTLSADCNWLTYAENGSVYPLIPVQETPLQEPEVTTTLEIKLLPY
jgi:hypothetical protein